MSTAVLDTVSRIATPEGCEIDLRLAGPVVRARAWFFDFLVRLVLWLGLVFIAPLAGDFGVGLAMLSVFLLEWLYPVVFEVHWRGQTPGKRACALAVVHDDGRPVGWGAAFTRNTLRFVDFLPLLYGAGFLATLLNGQGKRLGDLAAGTVVVHVGEEARQAADPGGTAGSEPPPFPLTPEEQTAVIEFSRRAALLTPERAAEVAAAAAPLTAGLEPEAGRLRLLRIANHLLGR
ncbi:MAG: RDD family protein [Rhodocyclaceae bacterium]|nr:RDD family protein [Rhodocyclaceae bacterium]